MITELAPVREQTRGQQVTTGWPLDIVILGEHQELKTALEALDHKVSMYIDPSPDWHIDRTIFDADLIICLTPFTPTYHQLDRNWWFPNGVYDLTTKLFLLRVLELQIDIKSLNLFFESLNFSNLQAQIIRAAK
jgi:hypothetical protein